MFFQHCFAPSILRPIGNLSINIVFWTKVNPGEREQRATVKQLGEEEEDRRL